MKVIFLTNIQFNKQHCNDLFIDDIERVFSVELWDLSKVYGRFENEEKTIDKAIIVSSIDEFEKRCQALEGNAIFITNIMFKNLEKIYAVIKRHNLEIAAITRESFCSILHERSNLSLMPRNGLLDILRTIVVRSFFLRGMYHKKISKGAKFDYLFSADNTYPEYTNHFIKMHHVKYDDYVNAVQSRYTNDRYILFLDSAVYNHPMYMRSKRKQMDEKKYLRLLNRFFTQLEEEYNCKVIISLHPKAEYSESDFEGREQVKYKTPQLIRGAEFIISHYSTSVINAVLDDKPLVFVHYKEMFVTKPKHTAIGGVEFSKLLNAPLVDLENIEDFEVSVDKKTYRQFKDDYVIYKGHEHETNAMQVIKFLKEYILKK